MSRKAAQRSNRERGHRTSVRFSEKPHIVHRRRPAPEQIETAAGRSTGNVLTELVQPVVRTTRIPVATAARIAGGVLGAASTLVMAPLISVMQAFGMTGGLAVKGDLKTREYRDKAGRIHHHTRTFERDHPMELVKMAA